MDAFWSYQLEVLNLLRDFINREKIRIDLVYDKINDIEFLYLKNEENRGVGYTINRGYDKAVGEYVVALGSDDYFYTEQFEQAMEELDGTDLVYFNLRTNNGDVWELCPANKRELCGSTKFMKRSFLGDSRCPDKRMAEDLDLYNELLKKNPTEKFTNITVKHYNFPREGSLSNILYKQKRENQL